MNEPEHTVQAPVRIDLAGGTLDIWPICQVEPDTVTLNAAISRRVRARARRRTDGVVVLEATDRGVRERHVDRAALLRDSRLPLHRAIAEHLAPGGGLELRTRSTVPAGSGLGGSSALCVAALRAAAAAVGVRLSRDETVRRARDIEAGVLAIPTGTQDYLPALHGGVLAISFPPGGPRVRRLRVDARELEKRLVLAYTGLPHDSALNNWEITKCYLDGDPDVRAAMGAVAAAARDAVHALSAGDFDATAAAAGREWDARKRLAPGVTTAGIERLGRTARAAGALSFKACGAGGGGSVVYWCAEGRKTAVTRALRAAGAEILPVRIDPEGAR